MLFLSLLICTKVFNLELGLLQLILYVILNVYILYVCIWAGPCVDSFCKYTNILTTLL
jgi:hypothetical protein